jgi:hypothetical protein
MILFDPGICYTCGKFFEEGDELISLYNFEADESYYVHKKCYHAAVDRELHESDLPDMR